jgi:hypothetical protein
VTIELVLLRASVVLGIVHIIMSHLQARKGLAIGVSGVIAGSGSLRNAAVLKAALRAAPVSKPELVS